nr:hypothetical protein OG690_02950 [Streptomyces tubercidicus]
MASNELDSNIPVFRGAGHLLRLIADLVRRPRRRECPEPVRHRGVAQGREGLPVLCLVSGDDHSQLAKGISYFLSHADPRRVPHCLHDLQTGSPPPDSVEAVRHTLERLAQGFARSVHGSDGRVRFRRFGLVNWLTQAGAAGGAPYPGGLEGNDHTLLQGLREREFRRRRLFGLLRSPETELAVDGSVPWWVWLFAVHVFPLAWFRIRRGLGREYRWLLNQPYLAPRDPGTFIGFAERLTAPHHQVEDPEQLRKLMVNAFLEDLRVAFRRRIWRPRTARRTAYCVALLDGRTPTTAAIRCCRPSSTSATRPAPSTRCWSSAAAPSRPPRAPESVRTGATAHCGSWPTGSTAAGATPFCTRAGPVTARPGICRSPSPRCCRRPMKAMS